MSQLLDILGRSRPLFGADMERHEAELREFVAHRRFLVLGGAGSIGREVVLQLAARKPAALDVVDVSENNLVEATRLVRSAIGSLGEMDRYFPLDIGSPIFDAFLAAQKAYDVVLNFAALKHVRSEKDAWSLMRMLEVNILNTKHTLEHASRTGAEKYFCVSTDKAESPANAMGASKRVVELVLAGLETGKTAVCTARFANVAFSDGSLLDGFRYRLTRGQPLAAPRGVRRYFLSGEEAGQLCLLATALGRHMELFFPKLDAASDAVDLVAVTERFLRAKGLEPHICETEEEARAFFARSRVPRVWPCLFTKADTTGEKEIEEFYNPGDRVDWDRYSDIAVILGFAPSEPERVRLFLTELARLRKAGTWSRQDLLALLASAVPNFAHLERGVFLDLRM